MPLTTDSERGRFGRIDAAELERWLRDRPAPLVLDIRRRAAFEEGPGVPGAAPLALDDDPVLLPDVSHDHPIVAYCL